MLGDFGETRQGPSGSVEVVGMGYRQTVEQPDGGVTSDVHHNDFGQASTDFHEYIQRSNVSGYDVALSQFQVSSLWEKVTFLMNPST